MSNLIQAAGNWRFGGTVYGASSFFTSRTVSVMVSVLAMSVIDLGSSPDRVKSKTMNLIFVTSLLSMQQ